MEKDSPYWKSVYDKAFDHLAELRAERDTLDTQLEEINKEIVQLEQVVSALTHLTADDAAKDESLVVGGIAELGLAEACRKVLQTTNSYRTARGVRDSLEASGYDLKGHHNNPLASIHGVLKRLVDSGEVEQLESGGKTRYRWKHKPITVRASGSVSAFSAIERAAIEAAGRTLGNPREANAIARAIADAEKLKGKI
jgi:hypothetical protein